MYLKIKSVAILTMQHHLRPSACKKRFHKKPIWTFPNIRNDSPESVINKETCIIRLHTTLYLDLLVSLFLTNLGLSNEPPARCTRLSSSWKHRWRQHHKWQQKKYQYLLEHMSNLCQRVFFWPKYVVRGSVFPLV